MLRFSRRNIIGIFLILVLLFYVSADLTIFNNKSEQIPFRISIFSNYTPHEGIVITGDYDFENQGWPGNGSEINPYRIEGLNISETSIGLRIQNTRAHFLVRNCIFSRTVFGENIGLTNITNGRFEDCSLPAWQPGIYMDNCSDIGFRNCTIRTHTNYALMANLCNRIDVQNCTIEETIRAYYCNDWILRNNTISGWCAQMIYCLNFTIADNAFIELGIDLVIPYEPIQSMEYYIHTIQNNTVNGKPLLYQHHLNGSILTGTDLGQIILIECNETMIQNGHFKLSGIPIQILSSYNCTLEGVSSETSYTGIAAIRSDKIQILNCKMNASDNGGIYLLECDDAKIIGCEGFREAPQYIYPTTQGIFIRGCERALIQHNSISDCEFSGIGVVDSPNSLVNENTIVNCNDGIVIQSTHVNVTQNTVLNSYYSGIWVYGNHSVFINNSIFDSELYGIYVDTMANSNQFYANQIGWNLLYNAQDFGFMNSWDDGVSVGNAWSDYSRSGFYYISGSAGSIDHYPSIIMRDTTPPQIEPLDDIFLSSAQLNQQVLLNWSIIEEYPSIYEVFLNGTLVLQASWIEPNILFEFNPLEIGTYNITLCVYDLSGYTASDTVLVHIVESTIVHDYFDPALLVLGIGIVGIMVVLAIVLKRKPTTKMLIG